MLINIDRVIDANNDGEAQFEEGCNKAGSNAMLFTILQRKEDDLIPGGSPETYTCSSSPEHPHSFLN